MTLSSVLRHLEKLPLAVELRQKLQKQRSLKLSGIARLPKGLVASSLAQSLQHHLLVVTATLEEAGRWAAQLELMGWRTVHFYPTSEASVYESWDAELEMTWGQMQVLMALQQPREGKAIVTTEKALQRLLPPADCFHRACLNLSKGLSLDSKILDLTLAQLGYERVAATETEGQWSRRGDIVDVFPVAAELPVRLEWFGDELERLREFDPASQQSLDSVEQLTLTPRAFEVLIEQQLRTQGLELEPYFNEDDWGQWQTGQRPEGLLRLLGLAFEQPASLLDYLPPQTLVAFDEPEQCQGHADRRWDYAEQDWQALQQPSLPPLHQRFEERVQQVQANFLSLELRELHDSSESDSLDLSSRPLPTTPHQFAKLAEILRGKREIYTGISLDRYATWLVSAQPSRTVSLLQEHDCPAQFIPNPKDYPAIEKFQIQKTAVALKYAGIAELEGFILPTFRIVVVTDRELFGQHALATPEYVRKRRRAASKQVDIHKLSPGDYVVHKSHGIGKFMKLEALATREYLVIQYADGLLRVPADSFDSLSRYRHTDRTPPQLHKLGSKTWEATKAKVRKAIKKLAVDLLNLYAKRAKQKGFMFPPDTPWQLELEDSFPYQATPDQLKAVQDVKRDLESERPMDRLVCGDVGFGKTEVAVRAIFKAVTSGHKQVALLAPTTVLTQQHYHTLKERFAPYPITVGLLNRFRTLSEKKEILERLASGELDIVVGTQQILGKSVKFKDLGLLVIDEEQRFGVNQKEKIKSLKTEVDVLTLTATPIPRTLYMSLSGIREMSLITTPPPSRRPIQTHVSPYNPEVVRTAIRNELDRGGQVFYVVPRIEGIEELAGQLQQMIPDARLAIGHGQMEESELESTMLAFNNGEADILICTTIIEAGLDIPRVNTIIVEDAQKFGLAQLYQLRGRVGRSGIQAHAWLLYPNKRDLTETARQRLRALQEFSQLGSGYQLATRDMEIRGVGSLLGAEQSGQMEAIGFELYMDMLQEAIREIQGQEIPKVEDAQIDLQITAFIPSDYMPDLEQKMAAYRRITAVESAQALVKIALEWADRYGPLPNPVEQLFRVVELKHLAKSLGFSRIKLEGHQNIVLETPMEEPAWKLLSENLPQHLRTRFVYSPKKVIVRGLGVMKPAQQLENLVDWFKKMKGALPEAQDG
ncbi:transcription-repair coupling factor [Synechocystis sp. LKSZ1]|uniref:transcription-repair coupling factor n=1 Tax=Synechocystis sp. LKSZ1 TaxID=3144951 RepID=UPI00336BD4F5